MQDFLSLFYLNLVEDSKLVSLSGYKKFVKALESPITNSSLGAPHIAKKIS